MASVLQDVDTVIFDFGGVIINVDYSRTQLAFEKLGIKNFDELYSQAHQSKLFDRLETGEISPQQFRDTLKELCRLHFDDHAIDTAWNAMLGEIPIKRLEFITSLRKGKQTFLLSNTNVIHIRNIEAYMDREGIKNMFYSSFDKVYFSYEMKMRKPDAVIFETVIEENNLNPARTLFVDDSIQHINGAAAVGLKTLFLEKGSELTEMLK